MLNHARSAVAGAFRVALLLFLVILTLGAISPVSADTIGVAVASVGSSTSVGLVPLDDGTITFYFPLTSGASGTYGVKGTSTDSCSIPATCLGGSLDMFLRFAPVQVGANVLTLIFNELHFKGVQDPAYSLESVTIIPTAGAPVLVDEATDPGVISASRESQILMLPVIVASSPFYVQLRFKSSFGSGARTGTYLNTAESIRATIRSVPEPLALAIFGFGLLALGIISWRKNQLSALRQQISR